MKTKDLNLTWHCYAKNIPSRYNNSLAHPFEARNWAEWPQNCIKPVARYLYLFLFFIRCSLFRFFACHEAPSYQTKTAMHQFYGNIKKQNLIYKVRKENYDQSFPKMLSIISLVLCSLSRCFCLAWSLRNVISASLVLGLVGILSAMTST